MTAALLAPYYAVLVLLGGLAAHRLLLVALAARAARRGGAPPPPGDSFAAALPRVTVQLPIYDELYVAARAVRAACALDWPRDRFEVQVLDDSDDGTAEVVAAAVAEAQARGVDARHLRRETRDGFKAGALAAGLAVARGELVAIFDADFVPAADFLCEVTPHFADPAVAVVQARWGHLNRDRSLLTVAQAMLLDAHFALEQRARADAGLWFNFNGTAGVWRRAAIDDAGGWSGDTLTEDLDLSYRAQLAGWRFVYRHDVVVPAELPASVGAFQRQQRRWASGAAQTLRKLGGAMVRSPRTPRVKAEALLHLGANLSYVLMVALALLVGPAMVLRGAAAAPLVALVDLPLFVLSLASMTLFYGAAQRAVGRRAAPVLHRLPLLAGLGIGISLGNAAAVLRGLVRRGGVFERTPKDGTPAPASPVAAPRDRRYVAEATAAPWGETAMGLYLAGWCVVAVVLARWAALPFLALFLYGYGWIAVARWQELARAAEHCAALRPPRAVEVETDG